MAPTLLSSSPTEVPPRRSPRRAGVRARPPAVFLYVVQRDFGFAPNPFHGYCTLACCKPHVRNPARIGDWVFGLGGTRLKATGRCVFAMRVTDKITFDEYWSDPHYIDKRVVPNGSKRALVGDNIYHRDPSTGEWIQEDSHHSKEGGAINVSNRDTDTKSEFVLISKYFYYFGRSAPIVPLEILEQLGYENNHFHRRFTADACAPLLAWMESTHRSSLNRVVDDPFDFAASHQRFDAQSNKIS